jgi:uncharacterized cofD-like protein
VNLGRWLRPGIGIKRWLGLTFIGLLLLALAFSQLVRQLGRDLGSDDLASAIVDLVTLQFLPVPLRGLLVGGVGLALALYGAYRVIRFVTEPLRDGRPDQPLVEVIYQRRQLARGPRIVAIGGGTGLSTLLRGLKEHTSNLTAVVTVADDGGSSGVLRNELGIPAVGDIRNCIVALADAEPLMRELLQYRFPTDENGERSTADETGGTTGLGGHPVGNLLLAAMTAVEGGDFEEGVRRLNGILAVRGKVVPVTASPLTLHANRRDGTVVDGQSAIMRTSAIERVWITPADVSAASDAIGAIAGADLIVLGPGSLYTSVLPGLLIPDVRAAVLASAATRMYVCNVATQQGETETMDLASHIEAIVAHTAPGLVDIVLANNQTDAHSPLDWRAEPVRLRWPPSVPLPMPHLVLDAVVDPGNAHHHDPARLAAAILRAYETETVARRRASIRTA